MRLVLHCFQPGPPFRLQEGLEISIIVKICKQHIAGEKREVVDTEFIGSSQPAKRFLILMGNGKHFCDVDAIPAVRPIHRLILMEPFRN